MHKGTLRHHALLAAGFSGAVALLLLLGQAKPTAAQYVTPPFMFGQDITDGCDGSCDSCTDAAAGCVNQRFTNIVNNGDGTCTADYTCDSTTYQGAALGAHGCNSQGQLVCQYSGFCQHSEPGGSGSSTYACPPPGGGGSGDTTPPDFAVTVNPPYADVAPGDTYRFAVNVRPLNDFRGYVNLSANCPTASTCHFSNTSVYLSGSDSANVTYTVSTTASTPARAHYLNFVGRATIGERTDNATLAVSNGYNNAQCVSMAINGPVQAGRQFTATVTMRNNGTRTWRSSTSHSLGAYDSSFHPWTTVWNPGRWSLPGGTVAPGTDVTFNVIVTAPSQPGTYSNFGFKMVQDGVEWFGGACTQAVTVALPPPADFTASCPAAGSGLRLSWTPVAGQPYYHIRINDVTNGADTPFEWANTVNSPSGTFTGANPTTANRTYRAWIHTTTAAGTPWSEAVYAANVTCPAAEQTVNGACGSANGQTLSSLASTSGSLCERGSVTGFGGTGPWSWNCSGSGPGATNASCGASKDTSGGNSQANCGPAHGNAHASFAAASVAGLCANGYTYAAATGTHTWDWTCTQGSDSSTCWASQSGNPPPPTPTLVTATASATCSAGTGSVALSWTDVAGETGYAVYRNAANNFGTATQIGATTAGTLTYTDTNRPEGTSYYWVVAMNGTTPSAPSSSRSATVTCPGANLSGSDKDIIGRNSTSFSVGHCNGYQAVPATEKFRLDDTVKFRIALCNSGQAEATNIVITDTLVNVARPANGWNMVYNGTPMTEYTGSGTPPAGRYKVSGSEPNQTITITIPGGVPAAGGPGNPGVRLLTFEGKVKAPEGFVGTLGRFQNRAVIDYAMKPGGPRDGRQTVVTGLIYFYSTDSAPDITETAP